MMQYPLSIVRPRIIGHSKLFSWSVSDNLIIEYEREVFKYFILQKRDVSL